MASSEAPLPWLSLRDIAVMYRERRPFSCNEFDIRRGELHVLTGKQGGGKTTLCNVICGEIEPQSGSILIENTSCHKFTAHTAHKLGIERVTAFPSVFPHLTVAENIAMGLNRYPNRFWLGRRSLVRKVAAWLTEYGITTLPLEEPLATVPCPDHLFIQVLASLFNHPCLLILDETLENLPGNRRDQIMVILRKEIAAGMSVLWATHQLEEGWRLADRLTILRQGQVLLTDLPGNIDRRSLLRLAFAQFPESEEDDRDRERFHNLILYTEALLRDLPLAIAIVDTQGVLQFSNRATQDILPKAEEYHTGKLSLFTLLKNSNDNISKAINTVLDGADSQSMHATTFMSPGGEKKIDCQVQAIRDGFVTIGAMLIIHDVSERERLRSRLILSHNVSSVGLLAAGVAHDVNNPLAAISNYLSYLLRKLPEGSARDTVQRIGTEAKNIQRIIDNLVAFSGHVRKDSKSVDLHSLTLELCTLLRFTAKSSEIVLAVIPPPQGVEAGIFADVKEMRQLLINLIRNAMEAMTQGGIVHVNFSRCTPEQITIQVIDTGPGIKLERVEDIFEPFVSTKNDDDRYHGIGLTIVYSLVEKYGGKINVANAHPKGCVFTLHFPQRPAMSKKTRPAR